MGDISTALELLTELKKDEDEGLLVQEIWAIQLGIEALELVIDLRKNLLRLPRSYVLQLVGKLPSETEEIKE